VYAIPKEGAPSLRLLKGWAAIVHALLDLLRRAAWINTFEQAFPTPPFAKEREGLATRQNENGPAFQRRRSNKAITRRYYLAP
jgi:hypothetical protein